MQMQLHALDLGVVRPRRLFSFDNAVRLQNNSPSKRFFCHPPLDLYPDACLQLVHKAGRVFFIKKRLTRTEPV
jgi:hypothetical protein